MSDMSERIRAGDFSQDADYEIAEEIERLTAENEELKADAATHDEQLTKVARLRLELEAENIRLQAKVEQLEGALRSIAANTCCEPCQEAKLVAKAALKGVDDE